MNPSSCCSKQDEQGQFVPWDRHDRLEKPCYDLRALHRNLDVMTTLIGYMQELGWGPYANDHEDANCQFEINWAYSDALTTADRNTFFRWMVRTVAEKHDLWATFMPKPFGNLTGNGTHHHISLWTADGGRKICFLDEKDGLGLSETARWFMGGLLHHAKALAAVTSPIVNSYKRLTRGAPSSGASWAPVYVTYGPSNRTQMIRVPGPGRMENRTADGAANPYLAFAATLAAGLDGIENKIDPGTRNDENLYEMPLDELRSRGNRFFAGYPSRGHQRTREGRCRQECVGLDVRGLLHRGEARGVGELSSEHQPVGDGELPAGALMPARPKDPGGLLPRHKKAAGSHPLNYSSREVQLSRFHRRAEPPA